MTNSGGPGDRHGVGDGDLSPPPLPPEASIFIECRRVAINYSSHADPTKKRQPDRKYQLGSMRSPSVLPRAGITHERKLRIYLQHAHHFPHTSLVGELLTWEYLSRPRRITPSTSTHRQSGQ